MAKSKTSFWTYERLIELDRLYKKMTLRELERHFSKRQEDILQAWEFWQQHKRLKISSRVTRKIRITLYRPAYAEDAIESLSYRDELTLL